MDLASDVTPEDIEVFLQEAEEHLSLLDEDIVRLERDPSNPDLLQEIFRAAHTLKGSSAMLGYRMMTELTHSMESLLDKLRKGDLAVDTAPLPERCWASSSRHFRFLGCPIPK